MASQFLVVTYLFNYNFLLKIHTLLYKFVGVEQTNALILQLY